MLIQEKIERLAKIYSPREISEVLQIDPRIVHRVLRNSRLLIEDEPDAAIRMRIRDTPKGRELAKRLQLKVNVIYPESE